MRIEIQVLLHIFILLSLNNVQDTCILDIIPSINMVSMLHDPPLDQSRHNQLGHVEEMDQ